MKLKLAFAALMLAGSASAQGVEVNQVELGFEHSKLFASGDSLDQHNYSIRADVSFGGGYGLQAGLRQFDAGLYEDRWGATLHGYKEFGDTRLGLVLGLDTSGNARDKLTYGAEFMTGFGDKLDLEGRLVRQEIGGPGVDINMATVKTWYDLNPRLSMTGGLRYANLNAMFGSVDEYSANLGVEYNFERAPLTLYGSVEHAMFGQDIFVDNVTTARIGMTFTFGGKPGTKPKRMFSRIDQGLLF